MRPTIIVQFADGGCTWASVGWGNDTELMTKAKKAINEGKTRTEVVNNLIEAGFNLGVVENDAR